MGATWIEERGKWKAQLKVGSRMHFLGYFDDEQEAARARDRKAVEVWGAAAHLNFPERT
jgi:hypothetical protein